MKDIDLRVKVKKTLIFWSLMAVAFVVCIPLMIVALVNGNWFVAIPCIAIVGFNFYGQPLGWVYFAFLLKQRNIYLAIVEDGLTDIHTLSNALGKRPKYMVQEVRKLLSKRYLRGYTLNEDCTQIVCVEKPKQVLGRCPACGAPIPADTKNCAYCHFRIAK